MPSLSCGGEQWPADVPARRLDETQTTSDTDQYPSGWYGCYTEAAWKNGVVYACDICDWGI